MHKVFAAEAESEGRNKAMLFSNETREATRGKKICAASGATTKYD